MITEFIRRDQAPQPILSIRGRTTADRLAAMIGEFLGEVFGYVQQRGGRVAGMPFTRIHAWEDDNVDVEAGLPLETPLDGQGRIVAGELPGGPVVSADHFGSYEGLPGAREELRAWVRDHGLAEAGPAWEIYWTDPGAEPDPNKWKTEVVLPVRPR